jgi:hypothetical protein
MDQGLSFLTSHDNEKAHALAAKLQIPWDEWVKIHGVCHHCHERGHIHPKCPKYLADIASGKIKQNDVRDNTRFGSCSLADGGKQRFNDKFKHTPLADGGKQRFNDKSKNASPKFKTLLAAFQAWSTDDDNNGQNEDHNHVEMSKEDIVDKDLDNKEAFGFFLALTLLKEWAVGSLVLTQASYIVESKASLVGSSLFFSVSLLTSHGGGYKMC